MTRTPNRRVFLTPPMPVTYRMVIPGATDSILSRHSLRFEAWGRPEGCRCRYLVRIKCEKIECCSLSLVRLRRSG